MASSEIEICRLALARIGVTAPIQSLDEPSAEAAACKLLYPPSRDAVLESHWWGFARKMAGLALLSGVERSPWRYAYALPTDCVAPRFIWNGIRNPRADERIPFEPQALDALNGTALFTDQEEVELVYTARIVQPGLFSALFSSALAWRLASELASALPSKRDLRADAMTMYLSELSTAAAADDAAERSDPQPEGELIAARS